MELAIKHTRGEIEQLTDHLKAERDLQQQDMYREMIRIEQEELNVLLDMPARLARQMLARSSGSAETFPNTAVRFR